MYRVSRERERERARERVRESVCVFLYIYILYRVSMVGQVVLCGVCSGERCVRDTSAKTIQAVSISCACVRNFKKDRCVSHVCPMTCIRLTEVK